LIIRRPFSNGPLNFNQIQSATTGSALTPNLACPSTILSEKSFSVKSVGPSSFRDDTNKRNYEEDEADFEPIEEISSPIFMDEIDVKDPNTGRITEKMPLKKNSDL
jgi:hypothetical protein